jgi:hypothetical protein
MLRTRFVAFVQFPRGGIKTGQRIRIICLRAMQPGDPKTRGIRRDWDAARKLGLPITIHTGGKGRVALSGVVLIDAQALRRQSGAGAVDATAGPAADVIGDGVLGEPAIKLFKPGTEVVYTCEVYDGRGKREEGFSTQAMILRDGKAIYTSPPAPIGGADEAAAPVGAVRVGGIDAALLPIGEIAQFRVGKVKLVVRVPDLDRKEREYDVISISPLENDSAITATK